jgi:molybdate transport system substrate-binding protein
MQRAFEDVKPAYEAASGRKLDVEFASTQDIVRRVQEGELADFLITSRAGVDLLIKAVKVARDNNFVVAQSSIALAVPAGHPKPDISTVEKLKSALLAAAPIAYTDPASGGPSGVHLAKVWNDLGIATQLRAKTTFPPPGGFVGDILARNEADIGIQQFPELSSFEGVDIVAPLPSELQKHIEYAVAIPVDAPHPEAGKA